MESDLIDLDSLDTSLKEETKKSLGQIEFKPGTVAYISLKQILSLYFRCNNDYVMSGDWFRGFKLLYQWLGPCLDYQPPFIIKVHPRFVIWDFQQLAVILSVEYWMIHTLAQSILEEKKEMHDAYSL